MNSPLRIAGEARIGVAEKETEDRGRGLSQKGGVLDVFVWKFYLEVVFKMYIYIYILYIYIYSIHVYDRYDRYRLKIVIYISILDVQLPLPFDKKMPRPPRSRKNLSCLNPISRRRQLKQRASSLYTCISIC